MLLALAVQTWLVTRTAVSSIDSVRFISIAQTIDAEGLLSVLHSDREQPLFPLVVCGVHHALDSLGVDRTTTWMRSVQVASVMGLLLAVPAIYLVARRMVGHAAALVGTAAFVLLPEVARIGPDGVADAWHLALAAWSVALVFGVRQRTEDRGQIFLVGAGILAALALLVRVEAVVLIGATLLGLLLFNTKTSSSVRPLNKPCLYFALGLALTLIPYLGICGYLSTKPGRSAGCWVAQRHKRRIG